MALDANNRRVVNVTTTRDVRRGDELTVSYFAAGMDTAGRRAYLEAKYNFRCCCDACGPG